MNWLKQNPIKIVPRTQSFINRTLYSILSITKKSSWDEIIQAIKKGINNRGFTHGNKNDEKNGSNVRCLKIQQCLFENQQQVKYNSQHQQISINKINKQLHLEIPQQILTKLFLNLSKLIITKCKLTKINFHPQTPSLQPNDKPIVIFPNLVQFDGSQNQLRQFPKFIYTCNKLEKIQVSNNQIGVITHNLAMMISLKEIRILENPVKKISSIVLKEICNGTKILQIQWKLHLILDVGSPENQVVQSVPSVRTNFTQGDQQSIHGQKLQNLQRYSIFHIKKNSLASSPTLPSNTPPTDNYIDLKQLIKQKLPITKPQNSHLIDKQFQTLLTAQHICYLTYIEDLLDQNLCHRYIDYSFRNKKYRSLDFLLKRYEELSLEITIPKENCQEGNGGKSVVEISCQRKASKEKCRYSKKEQNSLFVGLKKIKILSIKKVQQRQRLPQYYLNNIKNIKLKQPSQNELISLTSKSKDNQNFIDRIQDINFKINISDYNSSFQSHDREYNKWNSSQRSQWEKPESWEKQRRKRGSTDRKQFVMEKLCTYNSMHVQSIPSSLLKRVTLNQFVWLLNQLQFVESINKQNIQQIQLVFKLTQIQTIVDNIITSELAIENLFNAISHKKSLKIFLLHTQSKFLKQYHFTSIPIIHSILTLQDHQLTKYLLKKYHQFYLSLFFGFITKQSISNKQNNFTKEEIKGGRKNQLVCWKQIVRPLSKIYKFLYKMDKKFIKNRFSAQNTNNYLIQEYAHQQSPISKDNPDSSPGSQLLKQYDKFHQSCHQHFPKPRSKPKPLIRPVSSIQKHIEISLTTKNKISKSIDHLHDPHHHSNNYHNLNPNKQNIIIIDSLPNIKKNYSLTNYCLTNKQLYTLSLNINSTPRQYHHYSIHQKLSTHNLQSNNRKNSIHIISQQKPKCKYHDDKKKGISLCSNSIPSNKSVDHFSSANKKCQALNRTVYLDITKKNKTPKTNRNVSQNSKQEYINNGYGMHSPAVACSPFQSN